MGRVSQAGGLGRVEFALRDQRGAPSRCPVGSIRRFWRQPGGDSRTTVNSLTVGYGSHMKCGSTRVVASRLVLGLQTEGVGTWRVITNTEGLGWSRRRLRRRRAVL